MTTIVVGVDGSDRSLDAVVLTEQLAAASGATVVVVAAFPFRDPPLRAADRDLRDALEREAVEAARRGRDELAGLGTDRVEVRTIAQPSAAGALQQLAEEVDAALIVVGSSHTNAAGRVLPGSTAERLLHGAPCAVAVAPRDHRLGHRTLTRIGVAYDGSAEARAALDAATQIIAVATDAELALVHVVQPITYVSSVAAAALYAGLEDQITGAVREDLDAAIRALPPGMRAEAVVLRGDPPRQLAHATERPDLVVTGSRGYGPLRAVLAGGFTGRLLREAACPVMVVPRGVEAPLGALFAQEVINR